MRPFVLGLLLTTTWLAAAGAAPAAPPAASEKSGADKAAAAEAQLFDALRDAGSEQEAIVIETHLVQHWLEAASPAARLLVNRGLRDMQSGAHGDAAQDFDALVALQPDMAEAYHQRAEARFAAGDGAGAVEDLQAVLTREPRHFPALALLSRIAEARGDWQSAYEAWQKVMALDPKAPGGDARLDALRRKALGQDT